MTENLKKLIAMIDNVVNGTWSIPQFTNIYQTFYIDVVTEEELIEHDDDMFFGDINEKLDYIEVDPTEEEKTWGLVTEAEFIIWLNGHIKTNKY